MCAAWQHRQGQVDLDKEDTGFWRSDPFPDTCSRQCGLAVARCAVAWLRSNAGAGLEPARRNEVEQLPDGTASTHTLHSRPHCQNYPRVPTEPTSGG